MDANSRHTAAVVAVFLLLTAALVAYNALSAPPLTTQTAEIGAVVSDSSSLDSESSQASSASAGSVAAASTSSASSSLTSAASAAGAVVSPSSPPVSSTPSVSSAAPASSVAAENPDSSQSVRASSVPKRTTPPAQPDINLATATAEELCAIPKIGPVLAGRIIEYRDTYGPLSSLEELLEVKGIGEKLYETLCQYVYLE